MPGQESHLAFHNKCFMGDYLHKVVLKVLGGNQLDSRIIELVKEGKHTLPTILLNTKNMGLATHAPCLCAYL